MNIEDLMKELKNEVGPKLYNHSIGTMEEAERLAKVYNCDTVKAKVAGLLHDCGKSRNGDNLTHAKKSAELAIIKYGINDKEIIDAIQYHTTGRVNMNLLEKIIYIADKIEPNRDYEGVDELRRIAYVDINKALVMSLERTIEYVKKRNMELDVESVKVLNCLKEER